VRRLLVGALLLGALPGRAAAVAVRGHVLVDDAAAPNVAVILDGAVPVPPPRDGQLEEVWLSFVPKVQVLPVGSTLTFRNRDDESHTVHASFEHQTLFNLASVPRGQEQRVALPRVGVVTVACDLHAYMRAWVLVTRSPYAAVSGADGRFAVDNVAPGRYTVRAFRPGDPTPAGEPGRAVTTVEVGDATAELTLRLPRRAEDDAVPPPAPAHTGAHGAPRPPRSPIARWLEAPRTTWPRTTAAVLALSALAIAAGLLGAIANYRLAARRGVSKLVALLIGCGAAFLAGLLVLVGLHGAVATALGFGLFIGTVIFGAE
jgi:hypothetical protein